MSNDNASAYPWYSTTTTMPALPLRDWFAGQALVALKLSGHRGSESWFAETAYAQADAMLAARAAVPGEKEEA